MAKHGGLMHLGEEKLKTETLVVDNKNLNLPFMGPCHLL